MSSTCMKISRQDEKNRKQWLFATICFFFVYPIFLFGFVVALVERIHSSEELFYPILINLITGIIPFWMIWHCAYRKYGTKLLTFWLVIGPIHFLISTIKGLNQFSNPWIIVITILDVAVYIWWYILSLRLRKINKIIQIQKQGCDDFLNSISALKNAKSIEELDWKYSELIKTWPQFETASTIEYKSKKVDLANEASL